ncbi:hypothetical protein [Streptomyces sp. NPDC026294]|uniref:hypothetical protein n=1 Tax=unclassified Streptomyces TaxID=2593676 RepID=UPI0034092EE0
MEGSEANTCRFRHRLADLAGGPPRARAGIPGILDTLTRVSRRSRPEGPCVVSFHTGRGPQCPDLAPTHTWWPPSAPAAQDAGFRAVRTRAMRLRGGTIGMTGGPSGTEPRAAPAGQGSGDPSGLPPGRRRRGPPHDPSQERFDA